MGSKQSSFSLIYVCITCSRSFLSATCKPLAVNEGGFTPISLSSSLPDSCGSKERMAAGMGWCSQQTSTLPGPVRGAGPASNGEKLGSPCAACRKDPLKEQTECRCLRKVDNQDHVVCRAGLAERESKTAAQGSSSCHFPGHLT